MRRPLLAIAAVAAASLVVIAPAQAAAPAMSTNALNKCGFTTKPNASEWQGGSATLVPTGKIPAGKNTILQGKAATGIPDGTRLNLLRFNPAGKGCHGSFQPIGGGIYTSVKGGQYYINFQLDRQGTFGYALQAVTGNNSYEIEFRVTTS